jgi:hypothetical protein
MRNEKNHPYFRNVYNLLGVTIDICAKEWLCNKKIALIEERRLGQFSIVTEILIGK